MQRNFSVVSDASDSIHTLYDKNNSIYVSRECQKFLSNFVVKLGVERSEAQNKILQAPLQAIDSGEEGLNPALDLLTQILEVSFKENCCVVCPALENRLSVACAKLFTCDTATLTRAAKLRVLLCFVVTQEDVAKLEENIVAIIRDVIDVKNIGVVQTMALQCQSYWCVLKPRLCDVQATYQLDHQLLYIQVSFHTTSHITSHHGS